MFFFFSKVFGFLISPIIWIFTLLLFALFSKKPNRKRNLIVLAGIFLFVFTNKFIINEALMKWESPVVNLTKTEQYDYGIVLGGYSKFIPEYSRTQITMAGDRIWQTLQLYNQGKIKKILLTGWSGNIIRKEEPEAEKIKQYLISLKISEKDIISESLSRNTHENAEYTTQWLKKHDPTAKCIIITSASHMRRALGSFKKYDKNISGYPTNYYSEKRKFDIDILIKPDSEALIEWDILLKEITGYYIYKIMGYN